MAVETAEQRRTSFEDQLVTMYWVACDQGRGEEFRRRLEADKERALNTGRISLDQEGDGGVDWATVELMDRVLERIS